VAFEIGPEEMATWKRALGGALAGAWLAMFPLGFGCSSNRKRPKGARSEPKASEGR
jgi:hypothetical protein